MTTSNINSQLTAKETELYNSLIQLGDSKEIALNTVISFRGIEDKKEESKTAYKFAYES